MGNIRLSPKYGLNPTIPVCFWCGEEKNEIALLGRLSSKKTVKTAWDGESTKAVDSDIEAPRHCVIDYEPCDECKKNMALGIALMAASHHPATDGMPPVSKDENGCELYPVGKYVVLSENGVRHLFQPDIAESLIKARRAFVDHRIVDQILDMQKPADESGE